MLVQRHRHVILQVTWQLCALATQLWRRGGVRHATLLCPLPVGSKLVQCSRTNAHDGKLTQGPLRSPCPERSRGFPVTLAAACASKTGLMKPSFTLTNGNGH